MQTAATCKTAWAPSGFYQPWHRCRRGPPARVTCVARFISSTVRVRQRGERVGRQLKTPLHRLFPSIPPRSPLTEAAQPHPWLHPPYLGRRWVPAPGQAHATRQRPPPGDEFLRSTPYAPVADTRHCSTPLADHDRRRAVASNTTAGRTRHAAVDAWRESSFKPTIRDVLAEYAHEMVRVGYPISR